MTTVSEMIDFLTDIRSKYGNGVELYLASPIEERLVLLPATMKAYYWSTEEGIGPIRTEIKHVLVYVEDEWSEEEKVKS